MRNVRRQEGKWDCRFNIIYLAATFPYMKLLLDLLKKPITWAIVIVLFFGIREILKEGAVKSVIYSDGKGYYSYLPALFIFNDPTYEKSMEMERVYSGQDFNQLYLYRTEEGKTVNKYFPGIAVLQAPFFGLATAVSWMTGRGIDGYAKTFQFFFFLGSMFYACLGLLLYHYCLRRLFPFYEEKAKKYFPFIALLGTPLIYYFTLRFGLSHVYSFFMFGLFSLLVLKLKEQRTLKWIFLLGLTLGLTALIRPTNLLVVIMIPFLLGDAKTAKEFFLDVFTKPKLLGAGFIGFGLVFSILFLLWKWQTGDWFVWSYNGEGFDFFHPHLWEQLFSFRIGLFVHTPLMILAVIGSIYLYKENRFQFFFWWVYFLLNLWLIASWWCWDFETPFGNRPFTEHLFFLLLPLMYLLSLNRRWLNVIIFIFLIVNGIRYNHVKTNFYSNQRFTAESYFKSLHIFNRANKGRWSFTEACKPFGSRISAKTLFQREAEITIERDQEFLFVSKQALPKNRKNERMFYVVTLDKKLIDKDFRDVYLVVEATDNVGPKRHHEVVELKNDRLEGIDDWKALRFQRTIYDNFNEFDSLQIHIWNPGKKSLKLRNIKFSLEVYGQH